jgi:hypothetical protein
MSPSSRIPQWTHIVAAHVPHLSRPQATVLAVWSWATVMLGSAGHTWVSHLASQLCGGQPSAWRQRLREWTYAAPPKRGPHRQQIEVSGCFPAPLRWVLARWDPDDRRLALALDATTLADRFTVLTLSVLMRAAAVPIAWTIVGATTPGAWQPHWLALLRTVPGVGPADGLVLVAANRGWYAEWLFAALVQQGWHPFLRINSGGCSRCAVVPPGIR